MLPRARRLTAAADHRLVARRGRRGRSGPVSVSVLAPVAASTRPPADAMTRQGAALPPSAQGTRVAVVVPKKVGSAPVRNRSRRQLQEIAARQLPQWPEGCSVVVYGGVGVGRASMQQLQEWFRRAETAASAKLRS